MADVLSQIPGLGGYNAQLMQNQAVDAQNIQNLGRFLTMQQTAQGMQESSQNMAQKNQQIERLRQFQAEIQAANGDPTKVRSIAMKYAAPSEILSNTKDFKLSPGDVQFGPSGNTIASVPASTKDVAPSSDVKNYEYAKSQGFGGSFEDWQSKMKKLQAPSNMVTIKQEGAESATVGEGLGKEYLSLQKAGASAQSKINNMDRLSQLLEGVKTGAFVPTMTSMAALADTFGMKIDKNLPAKQAAEALSNEIALQLRNPSGGAGMPGALSDKDREFLQSMTPGIGKTEGGNALIIDTAKKLAKRDIEVAQIARNYRKKNGHMDEGFYTELAQYSEAHPLFGPSGPTQTPKRRASDNEDKQALEWANANPGDPRAAKIKARLGM